MMNPTTYLPRSAAAILLSVSISLAGPTTQPAVKVDPLPDGWVLKTPVSKLVKQFGTNEDGDTFFEIVEEPVSDFGANVDLMAWAAMVRKNVANKSKLQNREQTELKPTKIGGRDVVEYEVTGETKSGIKLHFRFMLTRVGDTYCNLSGWTTPSHWEDAQADFETLVHNLK